MRCMPEEQAPQAPPGVTFRQADLAEVIDLRHQILRQGLPRETAVFDGDAAVNSRHFAAVAPDGRVVGCATVHASQWEDQPAWQLRGMATSPDYRGRGLGRGLMTLIESTLKGASPVRMMWCNARTPAVGFYQRLGWRVVSDVFEIPTAGPHVKMVKPLDENPVNSPSDTPGTSGSEGPDLSPRTIGSPGTRGTRPGADRW